MEEVSIAEARGDLEAVLERVVAQRKPVAIRRGHQKDFILVAEGEWAAKHDEVRCLFAQASPKR